MSAISNHVQIARFPDFICTLAISGARRVVGVPRGVLEVGIDTYFEKKAPFDLLREFKAKDAVYAYRECCLERIDCMTGYPEAVGKYVTSQSIRPKHLHYIEFNTGYAGNFGMFKLSFMRSPEYQNFGLFLLQNENLYRYRWTEQNFFATAFALFLEKEKLLNWYGELKGIVVHKSASLGAKHYVHSSKRVNVESKARCMEEWGCSCENQTEDTFRSRMQMYGLGLEVIG
jgi:hypothetical protein